MEKIQLNITPELKEKIYKYASYALGGLLFFFILLLFSSAIIKIYTDKITPLGLLNSSEITDIPYLFQEMNVSFFVYKYFFLIFGATTGAMFFWYLYLIIAKHKNANRNITSIMSILLIFMLLSMLIGLNYVSTFKSIKTYYSTPKTSMIAYFIFGLLLLICKCVCDFLFGSTEIKDDLKESNLTIVSSFVVTFLALCALFFPLYIFPGTVYRLNGLNMITGKTDILKSLPVAKAYKALLIIFSLGIFGSFVANSILFSLKRKVFVRYTRIHNFVTVVFLVIYAVMGLNYILLYVDAKGFSTFFNTSMNTYSYIPLVMYACYAVGYLFTKNAFTKLKIEYKFYNHAEGASKRERPAALNQTPTSIQSDSASTDPIPAFTELDYRIEEFNEINLKRLECEFTDLTLPNLVNHIIQFAKYSKDSLSYAPIEIKSFIAGLGASRLAILQGMSGTGKTSLPKIFMEAINGYCDLVAVESSWRDKNELLGYYNDFNKKFTPKSFTQFLYKACLNKDVPYFIVLDEMNLSRIEYYFSDFLSLMEAREEMRSIKLFDVQLFPYLDDREEYFALRDGHTIDIPTNVWFIGTANRDESTFEISDKVYDRAQTLNFDKRAAKIYINEPLEILPKYVSYPKLRELFNQATKSRVFDAENYEPIRKVEQLLRPYKISFGNRILKQIEQFVKIYVACSEIYSDSDVSKYIHEAVDCIVFSKIVRKLEIKQLGDIESLIDEFQALRLNKCEEFLQSLIEVIE